jgi:protein ImuB
VWFPRFPTDRLRSGRRDDPAPPLLATVTQVRGAYRLAAVDAAAARAGLAPGLPLADARAQVPALDVAPADPAADARALDSLARWAGRYTPWTAVDGTTPEDARIPGGGLWLDVTGCAHLFGGEAAMLDDLCRRLNLAGYTARAGLAATPGAAWALARFAADGARPWRAAATGGEKDALAALPVAALRLAGDTAEALIRLGLRCVGDLYPLSRAALALRFGLEPCLRLDQALGERDEPLSPLAPPPLFQVRLNFPEPIGRADDIALALDRLLAALAARLARAGRGARRLDFTLFRVDGTAVTATVGTGQPSRDAAHLKHLFRDKLDRLDPGFGIETALLAARAVNPLGADQGSLDTAGAPSAADGGLDRLIDRLANRLGPGGVASLRPRASHLPERAQVLAPAAAPRIPAPPRPAAARPLYLLPLPEPLDVLAAAPLGPPAAFRWRRRQHHVVHSQGPERIALEWWRDLSADSPPSDADARDYYRVEDDQGGRFWLYRTGLLLPGKPPRWFLHGLFP